jgi:DNA-directed RNA polymerase III subunit RPC1
MFKRVAELCKRASTCPYCGYANGNHCFIGSLEGFRCIQLLYGYDLLFYSFFTFTGVVKKLNGTFMKIVHEKYRAKNAGDLIDMQVHQMHEVIQQFPDLKSCVQRPVELINPLRAFELLCQVPNEDLHLLWMSSKQSRPEAMIVWVVPVPPVPIRPSVPQDMGGGSTEDDLTMKLQEIIEMNNALRMALSRGATMKMVAEDWEFLQIQVALFVNGEAPGIPRQLQAERAIRGLSQRLKGKQGRFRGNLSGKRVDFSGRTVISPDPNLAIDQVGVPQLVAKVMTYPERVNQYNLHRMRQLVLNGPDKHPGANIVRTGSGLIVNLLYGDRAKAAEGLRIGDVVERHMDDDDIVLFNRQPSLHKMSIMAHRVKVFPWRTFRFNECACAPYNADFDGDEMNLHLPQTEEAKAEANELMQITHNLVSPRNGEPLVAATQDFLTGAYMLTQKDVFLTKAQFCRLAAYLSDAKEHIDIPPPAIIKPRRLWTGKQVISILVRPNRNSKCFVNVESEERFYTSDKHFCKEDGFVAFHKGELISGNLGKKTLGGDSKSGLFYALIRDFGAPEATRCMSRLAKLTSRFLGERGFSIGIDDVTPSKHMLRIKENILTDGQSQASEQISLYNSGRIKLKPGCDALQSLESEVNGILGKIRENCGKAAQSALNHRNAPLSMAQCGSKGSLLNISQMIACLGQQSVGGQRIQNGFVNRTLPHFPVNSLTPEAKGFVANSFFTGLTATEFFFHTMGGREGLVDTAVKTAETGYMARRLMKALEDLSMQYDSTVRNSEQTVVQFSYGDDGLNPQLMEKGDRPVDYNRLVINICGKQNSLRHPKTQILPHPPNFVARLLHDDSQRAEDLGLGDKKTDNGTSLGTTDGYPTHNIADEETLLSQEMLSYVQESLESHAFQELLPQGKQFLEETWSFFQKKAADLAKLETFVLESPPVTKGKNSRSQAQSAVRSQAMSVRALKRALAQMSAEEKMSWFKKSQDTSAAKSVEFHQVNTLIRFHCFHLTLSQLQLILTHALHKYHLSQIQPGEAVGAVGAQSLSEPGTQMTLKTFHFAGVASMNVTLGVPRLKEIINASNVISTPIIEARLFFPNSLPAARVAKAHIEKSTLQEVCKYIKAVYHKQAAYIAIKLDLNLINSMHLNITAQSVVDAIMNPINPGIKPAILRALRRHHLSVNLKGNKVRVFPPDYVVKERSKRGAAAAAAAGNGSIITTMGALPSEQRIYFTLQALKEVLPTIIVQGIPSVSRAVINEESKNAETQYHLLVEGYGLLDVMTVPGIDFRETSTNHIMEMFRVLGIEAARTKIAQEIKFIFTAYGISVDRRHLMLLSDVMTFKGEILGITRFGVAKMKESVLMLASFEKTTDHLFDAAVHAREDKISGVSECIIMGVPIPIGTGIMKLLQQHPHAPKHDNVTGEIVPVKDAANGRRENKDRNGKDEAESSDDARQHHHHHPAEEKKSGEEKESASPYLVHSPATVQHQVIVQRRKRLMELV